MSSSALYCAGRTHELDRAFGVRQQVGTPGRMICAPVVGPDRKEPITVIEQCQRMRALLSGLGAGRRDEPNLVDSGRAQPALVRGISTLSIRGATMEQEPVAGPTHQEALQERLIEAQPPPTNRAFPSKRHT